MSPLLNIVTILVVLTLANNAQATTKTCPENKICTCIFLPAMKKFNIRRYVGTWYEVRRKEMDGDENPKCVTSVSELEQGVDVDDDPVINENITQLVEVHGAWKSVTIKSKAEQVEKKAGRFLRTFPEEYKSLDGEYLVMDTDYNSYSVVARCHKLDARTDEVLAWIYTRTQKPDESVLQKAFDSAAKFGLKPAEYYKINCPSCLSGSKKN